MVRNSWKHAALVTAALNVLVAAGIAAQDKVVHPRAGVAGQWRVIGQVNANRTADHDEIVVRGNDNFHRIKFKVTDAPLNLHRLVVTYDNGAPDSIDVRFRIPENGESRVIDLRGAGQRSFRKNEFWYDTAGAVRGRADVTMLGIK